MSTAHRDYFFNLIKRAPGSPAPDWAQVLERLHYEAHVPKNPQPGFAGTPPQPFNGLTIMIDGGGNARGRIWFYGPEPNGAWFTCEYQVIEDGEAAGSFLWAWFQTSGGEPYPLTSTGEGGTEPPPSSVLEERVAALEKKVAAMNEVMLRNGDWLSLSTQDRRHYIRAQFSGGGAVDAVENDPAQEETMLQVWRRGEA